jgi:hypothetical protein
MESEGSSGVGALYVQFDHNVSSDAVRKKGRNSGGE